MEKRKKEKETTTQVFVSNQIMVLWRRNKRDPANQAYNTNVRKRRKMHEGVF